MWNRITYKNNLLKENYKASLLSYDNLFLNCVGIIETQSLFPENNKYLLDSEKIVYEGPSPFV